MKAVKDIAAGTELKVKVYTWYSIELCCFQNAKQYYKSFGYIERAEPNASISISNGTLKHAKFDNVGYPVITISKRICDTV